MLLMWLVGKASVGDTGHRAAGRRRKRTDVIGHELGASGAVEPHVERRDVLQRSVEGLGSLAGKHHPLHLDGTREGDGNRDAALAGGQFDADEARLGVEGVDLGF